MKFIPPNRKCKNIPLLRTLECCERNYVMIKGDNSFSLVSGLSSFRCFFGRFHTDTIYVNNKRTFVQICKKNLGPLKVNRYNGVNRMFNKIIGIDVNI